MKEIFEAVELELIIINIDDVICASPISGEDDSEASVGGI